MDRKRWVKRGGRERQVKIDGWRDTERELDAERFIDRERWRMTGRQTEKKTDDERW